MSACTSLRGSLTVEAAVVLPMFLMTIWIFWIFFSSMMIHIRIRYALDEVTGVLAQQSYLIHAVSDKGADDGEVSFASIARDAAWMTAAHRQLVGKIGKKALSASPVKNGSQGLKISAGRWDQTGDISLTVSYQLEFPGLLGKILRIPVSQQSRRRCWTGMQSSREDPGCPEEEDPIVFLTEKGSVFHRDINCYHLDLTIREIPASSVGGARNRDGAKYYPCEHCAAGVQIPAEVLITPEGNRYHVSRDCSGLKRTIRSVPLSQAGGRRPCSNCGQENRDDT